MAGSTDDERAEARRAWAARVYRGGDEAGADQSRDSTPEERPAMMWDLARDAWSLTGRPLPEYSREETPVSRRPSHAADRARE